jgi:putative spermidine/putrescine transport system permease protein
MKRLLRQITPYLLVLPAVILLLFFVFGMINGVLQGFGYAPFLNMTDFTFDYYLKALTDRQLISSIGYSLYLAFVSTALSIIGGVALSAALVRIKASRFAQLFSIQIPLMMAHIVVALLIIMVFASTGILARILHALNIIEDPQQFPTVVGAVSGWGIVLVYLWKEIPFVAFSTMTIMMNLSNRYSEASASLGASPLKTFFTVTLPLCAGPIIRSALIVFAFVFGSYEIPYLLGPTLPRALPVLAYYEFQNTDLTNRCYAMALNGISVAICLVLASIYFMVARHERKAGR